MSTISETATSTTTTDRYAHEGTGASARWTGSALLIETTNPVSVNDLREVAEWAHGISFALLRAATPVPTTPCPAWCTAGTSIDPWIRDQHEWDFGGIWTRVHHGSIGQRYRDQFEMGEPDGSTRLGKVERGVAPKRRALRDGRWFVVQEDGTETVR